MSVWSSRLASRRAVVRQVRSPADAILVVRILCIALVVPLLMRLPLPRLQALLEPRRGHPLPDQAAVDTLVATVLAVLRAGRPLVRTGCLTRGVTLYYFLRRAGVDVVLCFGLGVSADQDDGFDGHCWLTRNGEPFLEPRDPRPLYTVMYTLPPDMMSA